MCALRCCQSLGFSAPLLNPSATSPTESKPAEYDEQDNDQDDPACCAHDSSFISRVTPKIQGLRDRRRPSLSYSSGFADLYLSSRAELEGWLGVRRRRPNFGLAPIRVMGTLAWQIGRHHFSATTPRFGSRLGKSFRRRLGQAVCRDHRTWLPRRRRGGHFCFGERTGSGCTLDSRHSACRSVGNRSCD